MIRNFGTTIDDDAVRSLVLSTRPLGTREIMIINHTDCGMLRLTDSEMEERLRKEWGQAPVAPARFYSFTDAEENTKEQIQKARSHPWISQEVPIRGFAYDVHTGRKQTGVKTIVLVHGAFADASSWNGVIERLQQQGYTVIATANPPRPSRRFGLHRQPAQPDRRPGTAGRAFLRRRGHHQRRDQRPERRRPGLCSRLRHR